MKPKVQAQRKFAQGAYVPPSPNVSNTITNRRVNTEPAQQTRYFFRHNTSARRLLDSISFEGIHRHKPVVVLERLEDQQQSQLAEYTPEDTNNLLVPMRYEPYKIIRRLPSLRKPTNRGSTACLCSTSKGEKKKGISKRKPLKGKQPARTIRRKQTSNKRFDMKLRSSRPATTVDTEFSIDDDTPLMYFTNKDKETQNERAKRNSKNQDNQHVTTTTTNLDTAQSTPDASPNIAHVPQSTPIVQVEPLNTNDNDGFAFPQPVQFQVPTVRAGISRQRTRPSTSKIHVRSDSAARNRHPVLWAGTYQLSTTLRPGTTASGKIRLVKRFKRFRTGSGAHLRVQVDDIKDDCKVMRSYSPVSSCCASESTYRSVAPSEITNVSQRNVQEENPQDMEIPEPASPMTPRIVDTFSMNDEYCRLTNLQMAETDNMSIAPDADEFCSPSNAYDNVAKTSDTSLYSTSGIANWVTNSQAAIEVPTTADQATTDDVDDGAVAAPSTSYEQCDSPPPSPPPPVHHRKCKKKPTSTLTNSKDTPKTRRNKNSNTTKTSDRAKILEAPVFYPTEEEFNDPFAYLQKVMPEAAKFGICKIVAPSSFEPECKLADSIRFTATNQYIERLYSRWGPVTREICALRSFLQSQNIPFVHAPLMEGLEVNLPKLVQFLQRQGGLKAKLKSRTYIDTRKWGRLAEELKYPKSANPAKKLDQIYLKYLIPYDALTQKERQELAEKMDERWSKRNDKLLLRARNPLHRQNRLLGESESSDEDDSGENQQITATLNDAEECVIRGRKMKLVNFRKIAKMAAKIFFPWKPNTAAIESQYWKLVLLGNEHVCVYTASIDSGEGNGFTKNKNEPYGKHPWNLKMMSQHNENVLRWLGPVLGVTDPTIQFGMIFSTSCWHRDPHGLPWMEYMHSGPPKIWYGIPDTESTRFRRAVENLCPTACQNKSIWLPSDITMIPPPLLLERNVSMSRIIQKPGEYIVVLPKAYSSSICTGYTVSESVYFATSSWVKTVNHVFQELRQSCEPTMFSLEQLLIAIARDKNTSLTMLQLVHENFSAVLTEELENRRQLEKHGLKARPFQPDRRNAAGEWNASDSECEVCRTTLYLSRVRGVFRKNSSVCLRHALQVLDNKTKKIERRGTEHFEMEYYLKTMELKSLISSVIQRLTIPLQREEEEE